MPSRLISWSIARATIVGQQQPGALATQRLGDQERLRFRMEEAGRMELVELQVRDPAAGAPRHGDAVAGRSVRVAGVEVDLARPAARQHHAASAECRHLVGGAVEDVGAVTAARTHTIDTADQVDGDVPFEQVDTWVGAGVREQRLLDAQTGVVGGVDHPPMAVAALSGQVVDVASVGSGLTRERHPEFDQPADRLGRVGDREADRVRVAQPGASLEGVLDVCADRVAAVDDRGDSALGIARGALVERALGEHRDVGGVGELQGRGQAGGSAADHQHVMLLLRAHDLVTGTQLR
jgi:hypothetical protein